MGRIEALVVNLPFYYFRITKTHRHQGKNFWVIKHAVINAQPFFQVIAAFIIPWYSGFMNNLCPACPLIIV